MGICVSCRRRDLQAPEKRTGGAGGGRVPYKGAAAELLPRRFAAMANSISNIKMTNPLKGIVSKRRKRYIKDGFNLDLAYITDRLIAMGFPAERLEGVYRNHIDEVFRFLETMHKDHYKIYNLCSERCYDSSKFHGRVARYPFEDHTPPKMEIIQPFCEDMHEWLSADPRNVAAVHCKAGKGRTGTMVCCYLLYSGQKNTADEALKYYGNKRTHDDKGVTIPSQRRYVEYYAALVRGRLQYSATKLHIRELVMSPPPALNGTQCSLELTVSQASPPLKAPGGVLETRKQDAHVRVVLQQCTPLRGDVRVDVYCKPKMMMRKERLFHFWFNTFFVANGVGAVRVAPPPDSLNLDTFKLTLSKWQLDDAHKDKLHKIYSSDFKVEVILQQQPESSRFLACGRAPSPPSSSASDCTDPDPDSEHWDSGEHAHAHAHAHAHNAQHAYYRLDDNGLSKDNPEDCQPCEAVNCPYVQAIARPEGNVSPRCMQVDEFCQVLMPLETLQEVCPHGCVNEMMTVADFQQNSRPDELCPHGYRIVTKLAFGHPSSDVDKFKRQREIGSDCTEKLDMDYGEMRRSKDSMSISYTLLSENADIDMASSCNNCIQLDFTQNCAHKSKSKKHDSDAKTKSLQTSPIKTMGNAGMLTQDGHILMDRTPRHQKDSLTRFSDPSQTMKPTEKSENGARISDPTGGRKCRHAGMVSKDGYMLVDATPRQPVKDPRRTGNTSTEILGMPVVTNMKLNPETLAEDYMEFTATDGHMKPVDREAKITNYCDEYALMCPDVSDERTGLCEGKACKIVAGKERDDGMSEACVSNAALMAQGATDSKSGKNKKHSFFKKDDYKNEKGKIPKVSSDHTISDESKKKSNFFQRRDEDGSKPKFPFGDVRASWREFSGKFSDNRKKKDRDDS